MSKRTITGLLSAAYIIFAAIVRGSLLDITIWLVALIACFELLGAAKKGKTYPQPLPLAIGVCLSLPALWVGGMYFAIVVIALSVLCAFVLLLLDPEPHWTDLTATLTPVLFAIVPTLCMWAIVRIQDPLAGGLLFILPFFIAGFADTSAYYLGTLFGKHKMTPVLSPNKTWEGAGAGYVGAIVAALLVGLVGSLITPMPPWWHFLLLGLVGGVAAQVGDLLASLYKRHIGIKDYGTFFPGQGGMMDRFDSIYMTTVVVTLYCLITGLF